MSLRRCALPALLCVLAAPSAAPAAVWQPVSASDVATPAARALVRPTRFAATVLHRTALDRVLARAPREGTRAARFGATVITLPAPDGSLARFRVWSSPVMEAGLAARHPEIRTFAGQGVDDATATLRLDSSPLGVHASVRSARGAWYVDPRYRGDARHYVSYARGSVTRTWFPPADPVLDEHAERAATEQAAAVDEAVSLRTYRLALVTDPTYAKNSGALDGLPESASEDEANARVTAAKVALMNRINHVYEQDFGVRMLLVNATDRTNLNTLAAATGANGPCGAAGCFTAAQIASCGSGTLDRNSLVAGMLVGARNFDIGHIAVGVNGGGIAALGVVGDTNKAQGCTGIPKPIGDYFAIDYVAHEMGHEFGGNHTFNGTQVACGGLNRQLEGLTTVEPGSGTTIMAYAGICGTDDLQAHSDPYFSEASIAEMGAYIRSPNSARASVQQVGLRGFDGTDTFRLSYGGATTAPIVRGSNYTAAGVKAAIEAVTAGTSVTVTGFDGAAFGDAGFQVTFGAAKAVPQLALAEITGASGVVGETVAGGTTTHGGKTITATENHAPSVTTTPAFTIPLRTPFTLRATGGDADGDAVTYLWEQTDVGPPGYGTGLVDNHKITGPLFRVFGTAARYADPDDTYLYASPGENLAGTDPTRTFPDLPQVLADNTNALTGVCRPVPPAPDTPVGRLAEPPTGPVPDDVVDCYSEYLPTATWVGIDGDGVLHFRVTARDNHAGTGGVASADTALTLARGAGPFRVLDLPALPIDAAGTIPVRWDVARTDVLTGTADVRISLSTDGGKTFPIVLAAKTPNDGSEAVAIPAGVKTTRGRVMVEAVGNVFFDVSHADLAIG